MTALLLRMFTLAFSRSDAASQGGISKVNVTLSPRSRARPSFLRGLFIN